MAMPTSRLANAARLISSPHSPRLSSVSTSAARPCVATVSPRRIAVPHLSPRSFCPTTSPPPISISTSSTPPHPPPLFTANAADHEKDNELLRSLFDAPPSSSSSSSSRNSLKSSGPSTGLFEIPSLTSPQSFLTLAQKTLARAQLLVDRIDRAGSVDATTTQGRNELHEVVRNLDRLSDLLCGVIDMAELVRNAHPNPDWAEAANAAYEYLCGYMNVLNTHTGLYRVLKNILATPDIVSNLSTEAVAVAQVFLRDFEKSGIHLPPSERERFVQLSDEILVLGRGFLQDIAGNDASDDFARSVGSDGVNEDGNPQDSVQIPSDWLYDMSPQLVRALKSSCLYERDGVLHFSALDHPWAFQTILKYAPDARARKAAFRAANYGSRAQVQRLERLLKARAELATLTGAASYSEMALGDKMAKEPRNVEEFLRALTHHHRPRAAKDLDKLRNLKLQDSLSGQSTSPSSPSSSSSSSSARARSSVFNPRPSLPKFEPWDREMYTDHHFRAPSLRSVQPLSPYFSLGSVFAGLSRLFSSLYGIRFRASTLAPGEVWSDGPGDVMKVEVLDAREGAKGGSDGAAEGLIGTIYADLWGRDGKPGGAAHYTVRCSRRVDKDDEAGDFEFGRAEDGSRVRPEHLGTQAQGFGNPLQAPTFQQRDRAGSYQLPVVVLMCDFSRPGNALGASGGTGPCLLAWHEVETLFHEMGHAVHSMIGRTSYHNVSGTRCATDFVELPSILMEHFVASPSVVSLFARHHATGATLPYEHLASHLGAVKSLEGLDTYHQILLARLDQVYHSSEAARDSFDSTRAYQDLDSAMSSLLSTSPETTALSYTPGSAPQVRFGHLFGYGSTYYSYLLDRAIASKVWQSLFADNPLDPHNGHLFKNKCLKFGGGKDPWHLLADLLGTDEIRNGDSRAMMEVGKWGIE
ncbi:mitochondrial intermediate peptidase [Testicularia cyperi]|uniref:mitochondrial intermediate peptidase n=1 Tax=Testicularia cyperi TaxID=1882483 RepID=A0A317XL96_9BASI|nr:mitochondrial intermediate peptidase [Testicularia cyperi]